MLTYLYRFGRFLRYYFCCSQKDRLLIIRFAQAPHMECQTCGAHYPISQDLCRPTTVAAAEMQSLQELARQNRKAITWDSNRQLLRGKPVPHLIQGRAVPVEELVRYE